MTVYALGELVPAVHPDAYVHPDAVVIGNVEIGAGSTIWPSAVLRGDNGPIVVGERTSIQDGSVLHATAGLVTYVGNRCVVGHIVHLEGCTIEDDCLVGNGAIVQHRAVIRSGALVGANAFVGNGVEVPSYAMALGVPAKIRPDAVKPGHVDDAVRHYVENGRRFRQELRRID
ncbi:gamma carbonic anhydrase family protein [Yinghuangia sp. ASG 101]|uniref:gamma carbonic anhydrase family protein n=1 Tax=Yinghuangia sp. ASG 101 TaxID=2896848 RepID=UPI001E30001C|nr:gamma carbonic anhydrase family protein [Yinghuangia sp. ASG 101]UGQ13856.1 gamma carbonic anhydrase family protein [Yinghuangia sp. ASG 101]